MTENPRTLARIAGLLYLALVVTGAFAEVYVRGKVLVAGDAAATFANITEHRTLFELGIASDVLMATLFIFLAMTLRRLLHAVDERAATSMFVFASIGAGMILTNLTFHAGAATTTNADAALFLLEMHHMGYGLAGIFFGLWLLPLGWLVRRSPLFPRILGVLLIAAAVCWLFDPVLAWALPDAPGMLRQIVSIPTSIGEFGFLLYILIRGTRPQPTPAVSQTQPPAMATPLT